MLKKSDTKTKRSPERRHRTTGSYLLLNYTRFLFCPRPRKTSVDPNRAIQVGYFRDPKDAPKNENT